MKKLIISTLLLVAALTTATAAEKYAVLITGIYNATPGARCVCNNGRATTERDDYWNDTYLMWEQLVKYQGYKQENVIVLYGDGNDCTTGVNTRYLPGDQTIYSTMTDYPATKAKVQEVLTALKTKSTTDDFLFVWTFGHGFTNPQGNAELKLYTGGITDTELAALTNPIPANKKVYWMQQFDEQMIISK